MQKPKLILGTVQLGMKYGLNNILGQPTEQESFRILDAALAGGISTFDTAHAYGGAEDVLGRWIAANSLQGKVNIISKLKPHVLNDYPDGTRAGDIVKIEIEKSLKRLGLNRLDGYLLHSPHYIYLKHVLAGLQRAKSDGLVSNVGVSTYDEAEALQAAELAVDYIQVPYNAFDQRLDKTNFFTLAKKNNVTVFARAPFLQGLLVMDPSNLPPHLAYARPHLEEFTTIARKHALSPAQLALAFVLGQPHIQNVVFGVDSSVQLQQNLAFFVSPPKDLSVVAELEGRFKDIDRGIVMPSLWKKIK